MESSVKYVQRTKGNGPELRNVGKNVTYNQC